jgi:leucyl aminopeptidase
LPAGTYRLENPQGLATAAALGWALGCYAFVRYRPAKRRPADLVWPEGADRAAVQSAAAATEMVRDLVNTPAADLGPAELEALVGELAGRHGATFRATTGSELLDAGSWT